MAIPMTYTQFTSLLKEWSIPTEDNSRGGVKWYNHNRNHKGKWGPVYGIGNHHTGADDNAAGAKVLWEGYPGLPGPLCHAGIRTNGAVLLNGWGRCNHFGLGDDDVLHTVIQETTTPVRPNEANTDGNRHFLGFEWMYDGLSDPATKYPKMYRTAVRLNAAICTFYDWKAESCIGHSNWQPGKWDPGFAKGKAIAIATFQNHVEQAIKEGPKPPLPTRPPSTITTYTVQKGDTLAGIAKKYRTTVIDLVNLNPGIVQPGMKLTIKK